MKLLKEISNYPEFAPITVDLSRLRSTLGIDFNEGYANFSEMPLEEVSDLLMVSIVWMEYVNERLAYAKKLRMDEELLRDKIIDDAIATSNKVTEARSIAKSSASYLTHAKRAILLSAYCDFLIRLLENLDKVHYVVKATVDSARAAERKYTNV